MVGQDQRPRQMECRIVITHARAGGVFEMGMYDPKTARYEPLGSHPVEKISHIVGDLKCSIERRGHLVTFSEVTAPR